MLKKTITYTNFNDEEKTEDLYFHIRSSDSGELLELREDFEKWAKITSEPERELTPSEIKEMLDLTKTLIEMSYGVRSEDGEHFYQGEQYLADFKSTAAYDAFLFSLFENSGAGADEFILGIMPKEFANVVDAQLPALDHTKKEVPAYIREDRDPTDKELRSMNSEELRVAFQRKQNQKAN